MNVNREIIEKIVKEFYAVARNDFMIGYHFRHIKDFDEHIERINEFWCCQFKLPAKKLNLNLKQSHEYLKIKSAEVNRWVLLFKKVLEDHADEQLEKEWMLKIEKLKKTLLPLC